MIWLYKLWRDPLLIFQKKRILFKFKEKTTELRWFLVWTNKVLNYSALAFFDLCFLCFLAFLAGFAGAASAAGVAAGAAAGAGVAAGAAGAGVCAALRSEVDNAAALRRVIKSLFILIKSKKINRLQIVS